MAFVDEKLIGALKCSSACGQVFTKSYKDIKVKEKAWRHGKLAFYLVS